MFNIEQGAAPTAVACPKLFFPPLFHCTDDVASKQAHAHEDIQFRVLKLLQEQPELKQRELADKLGVSLGKTNYCLRALVEKGQLKLANFMRSNHRMGYVYALTPAGLAHKAALTSRFLQRKRAEYEALKAEIEALQAELPVAAEEADTSNSPAAAKRPLRNTRSADTTKRQAGRQG